MLKLILLLYNLFRCIIVVIYMIENDLPKAFFQQSHFHNLFNSQLNPYASNIDLKNCIACILKYSIWKLLDDKEIIIIYIIKPLGIEIILVN